MAKSTANGSVLIGINVNKIPNMKTAIQNYKTAIKTKSNIGVTDAFINRNLKGENAKKELKNYVASLDAQIDELIKKLDKLSTNLDTTKSEYDKQDVRAGNRFSKGASSLKS